MALYKYPHTDLNQPNLIWMVKQIKEDKETADAAAAAAGAAAEVAAAAANVADNARADAREAKAAAQAALEADRVTSVNGMTGDINLPIVADVQIDGESIVEDGTAIIPAASFTNLPTRKLGLVKAELYGLHGIAITREGEILTEPASLGNIDAKQNANRPIVPSTIDYAVKKALTDSKISWTEEEKRAARSLLGIT